MNSIKTSILQIVRNILPRRLKRWLFKLSVSETQEGSMFFHINNLRKLGFNPRTIIDLGAFRGEWTLQVLPIFPQADFVMIEPQQSKASVLQVITAKHQRVRHLAALVGKEIRKGVVFYEMESGSSIYEELTTHVRQATTYDMNTLDELLIGQNVQGEYFLKMDVQGAELDVLEGAKETLKQCNFLLLEASVLNYNEGAPLVDQMIAYLGQLNFVLFDIVETRRKPDGTLFQVDLIFSRADSAIRKGVNFSKAS